MFLILGNDSSSQRGLFVLEIDTETNNLVQVKVVNSEFMGDSFSFTNEF